MEMLCLTVRLVALQPQAIFTQRVRVFVWSRFAIRLVSLDGEVQCEMCILAHTGPTFAGLNGESVVDVDYDATATVLGCNFTGNTMSETIISASDTTREGSLVSNRRYAFHV